MIRNPYFDNIRVALIFFVVFGHVIQPFINDSEGMRTLYIWIYIFHMPAFIFISGYFAKGHSDKRYIVNLFKKLLLPYIIFQIIYTGYYYLLGNASWQTDLIHPQWSLWFLVSLFSWHILLILFKKIRPIYAVSIAVVIGMFIGYINEIGHAFSLSRTFVFFPFFLMGFYFTEKQIMMMKRKVPMVIGLVVMVSFAVVMYYFPNFNTGWLLASKSFNELDVDTGGALIRLLFYMSAFIMMIAVFAWIPKKEIAHITPIGSKTLYIYLLHGFFIQYFRHADLFQVRHIVDVIGLVVISAALVYVLSTKTVAGITQPLIDGKTDWWREQRIKRNTQTTRS